MQVLRKCSALLMALSVLGCTDKTTDVAPAISPPDYLSLTNGRVYLERGPLRVSITPAVGGRIESLSYGAVERLAPRSANNNEWGNVLWTSPQADWGWPPPEALDSAPYRIEITATGVQLHSSKSEKLGVSLSKAYALAENTDTLIIDYQILNQSDREITLAPWEITRLPAQGQVFFPKGDTPYHSGQFAPLDFTHSAGIAWFDYAAQTLSADHYKSMTDGDEGWLAYQADDWLFVKAFENVPADLIAPGEGEIELYAKGDGSYIELEQQGYLTTLLPGEALDWRVLWAFELLPQGELQTNREWLVARARQLAGLALNDTD
ncbi:DUF4380 domain-containing protein [Gilvimarinus sp. SDUM040013]|uniref:DUF4380 domain-containing protein n=1 Tax=Gilvimarinus gilvus TaxID=3058038 RepID=A0ABU4RT73_9GAMM|nr:DUF4380 domain-containing protein [Gilvimarinus sp. SDUM040013]MDO3387020.1 DUF4380 domain-containing protein [Gilvimarinus sp. SDUM040013]MDX6848086.1 DUF4380 domain-containing protein [Gilvimarinus sp. SDUM040013]